MTGWNFLGSYASCSWSTTTLTCLALGLTLYYALKPYFGRWKFPPGPTPLPFIGHTLSMFAPNLGKYRYGEIVFA